MQGRSAWFLYLASSESLHILWHIHLDLHVVDCMCTYLPLCFINIRLLCRDELIVNLPEICAFAVNFEINAYIHNMFNITTTFSNVMYICVTILLRHLLLRNRLQH